jgi:hypothetical protein
MKMYLFLSLVILVILIPNLQAQNAPLDIRIAENFKPSEANSLYYEYNQGATNYNYYKKSYNKENRNSILLSIVYGAIAAFLAPTITGTPKTTTDQFLYRGLGFGAGFIGYRNWISQPKYRNESKDRAKKWYNHAMEYQH